MTTVDDRPHKMGMRLVAGLAIAAVFSTSCSDAPSPVGWAEDWRAVVSAVPSIDTLLAADDDTRAALCSETVGALRSAAVEAELAPDDDVERAALDYLEFAEAVFFECPLAHGSHAGFEAGYAEMGRLAAVVETLLEIEP